jgi:hypothetical protein
MSLGSGALERCLEDRCGSAWRFGKGRCAHEMIIPVDEVA